MYSLTRICTLVITLTLCAGVRTLAHSNRRQSIGLTAQEEFESWIDPTAPRPPTRRSLSSTLAGLNLTITPNECLSTPCDVLIEWDGLTQPSVYDYIALYTPETQYDSDYVGYQYLHKSRGWTKGAGSLSVTLVNVRVPWEVRMFATLTSTSNTTEWVASSEPITFSNWNEALYSHLAPSINPNYMRLMWLTNTTANVPRVEWGDDASNLTQTTFSEDFLTYTIDDMCGAPANLTANFLAPGTIHDVELGPLERHTTYYYRYGNDVDGWSPVYSFESPRMKGDLDELRVILTGDTGTYLTFESDHYVQAPAQKTYNWIEDAMSSANPPSLVLHVGDISYARGYSHLWFFFMHEVQELASHLPMVTAVGNHEYDWPTQGFRPTWSNYGTDSGGECGVNYNHLFHMPSNNNLTMRNYYYSFDYGPVHFLTFSTEHNFLEGSEQWEWMQSDLASVNRTETPWIVVQSHRPMYSTSAGQQGGINEHLLSDVEPLYLTYGVDLALVGHVHKYERSAQVANGTLTDGAPVHVVIGVGGNQYQSSWENDGHGHTLDQPDWSVFRSAQWGWCQMTANATNLYFEYRDLQEGAVHDSFTLYRSAPDEAAYVL